MPDKSTSLFARIPVLPFIVRTWPLLLLVVVTNVLSQWKHVFSWVQEPDGTWRGLTLLDLCGPMLYLPSVVTTAVWLALWLLSVRNTKTIEADALSGKYEADWAALTSAERVWNTSVRQLGYLIAAGLIAAALVK